MMQSLQILYMKVKSNRKDLTLSESQKHPAAEGLLLSISQSCSCICGCQQGYLHSQAGLFCQVFVGNAQM